jgi:hypothetical protein
MVSSHRTSWDSYPLIQAFFIVPHVHQPERLSRVGLREGCVKEVPLGAEHELLELQMDLHL